MKRFGAYEILHELSQGGMGSVLLARRRGPGTFEQLVAIKTIRTEYASAAAVRAMFLDEAAILARLNHPAVATVHDFGEEAGTLYMVMEYVAGVSLRGMIGQMPPGVAARAIAEACRGLHAAHELRDLAGTPLGLVHRDISPDNIMLGFDGHVKVIDFGIALVKNRQAPVTEFGTVKGKPPYMSPEQVKNEAMDRRSDVFSLGVVLHELLTGQPLFEGDSIYAIARAVEHQALRPPSHARPVPPGLDAAVMRALERDVTRRTPSAAAFAEDLEGVIHVAGDETLEAWAERELAVPRDAHRRWIAGVVAGQDTAARPLGRPTASVTALDEKLVPPADDAPVGARDEAPVDARVDAPVGARADAPRRRALPIVLAVLVLAGIVGGIVLVMRMPARTSTPDAARTFVPLDAMADLAADAMAGLAADAMAGAMVDVLADDALADAAPERAVDARTSNRDLARDAAPRMSADAAAPRMPPDAAPRMPPDAAPRMPPDAAPRTPAAADGFGTMTAKNPGGSYLNVVVDGKLVGVTPMFKKPIAAGRHVIELVTPDTNAVVVRREVTVVDGQPFTIQP